MLRLILLLALASLAFAQDEDVQPNTPAPSTPATSNDTAPRRVAKPMTIPAGTHVPIALRGTISTKNSHVGDQVYAQTNFPVVIDDHILIPAGTYVQGKISEIKPAGRIKGHAEVLMHFTSMIYPSGYTVMLPGSIEDAPGADKAHVKDKEGTIQADGDNGRKARTIGEPTATGAVIGGLNRGGEGALIGAGIGGAIGTTIAMLSHGNEVKLGPGTTFEVILQRDVTVDLSRIGSARLRVPQVDY
jgi:type IV secretion system protein VirB10